jgi:hypothetical protein
MIARVLVLGVAMVFVGAANVHAQNDEEYDEEETFYQKDTAAYVELSLAGSYFDINDDDGDDRGSGGVGAIVGGHVGAVRMEVQYEWFDYSATHLASYNLGYTFLPSSRFQPYVKAGIGIMGGRPSHPFLLMGRADLGVNLFLTEQWALAPVIGYAGAKHSNDIFMGGVHIAYYFE